MTNNKDREGEGLLPQWFIDYLRTGKEPPEHDNIENGYSVPEAFEALVDDAICRRADTLTIDDSAEVYVNPAASQAMLDDVAFDVASWLAEEVARGVSIASTGPTRILRDPFTAKPYIYFYITRPARTQPPASEGLVTDAAKRILSELDTASHRGRFSSIEETDMEIVCRAALQAQPAADVEAAQLSTLLERVRIATDALEKIANFEPWEKDDTPPHTQIAITAKAIAREALVSLNVR